MGVVRFLFAGSLFLGWFKGKPIIQICLRRGSWGVTRSSVRTRWRELTWVQPGFLHALGHGGLFWEAQLELKGELTGINWWGWADVSFHLLL